MNKKGFTLVELLAVIAILAILVIIALPNVLSMFNQAKKDTFVTESREYLKTGQKSYLLDGGKEVVYTNLSDVSGAKTLDMESGTMQYYIKFDSTGKCTKFLVTNGTYKIEANDVQIDAGEIGDKYKTMEAQNSFTLVKDTTNGAKINGPVAGSSDDNTGGGHSGSNTGDGTGGNTGGNTGGGHSGSGEYPGHSGSNDQ